MVEVVEANAGASKGGVEDEDAEVDGRDGLAEREFTLSNTAPLDDVESAAEAKRRLAGLGNEVSMKGL